MHKLAVAVPLAAVAAVCQGEELVERQGSVPGAALPVAWGLGLGSKPYAHFTEHPLHPIHARDERGPVSNGKPASAQAMRPPAML